MRQYMMDAWPKILDRQAFKYHPLSGEVTENGNYIVYSYTSPIAVCLRGRWFLSRSRHSELSSEHLRFVHDLLQREYKEQPRWSNPVQFRDVLNAARST